MPLSIDQQIQFSSADENAQNKKQVEDSVEKVGPVKTSSSLTGHDLDLSFEPDYDLDLEPEKKSSPVIPEKTEALVVSKRSERDESSDSSSSSSDDDSDAEGDRSRRKKHRKHKKNKHKKAKKSKKIKS